jgi:hypothetical protein
MQPSERSLGPGRASLEGYVSIEQMSGSELGCPAPHPRPWPVAVTSAKLLLHEVQVAKLIGGVMVLQEAELAEPHWSAGGDPTPGSGPLIPERS